MHEFSIATSLIEQVEDIAKQNNASKVNIVELEVGSIRQVVPDIMQTAWQSATIDTLALNSKLIINEIQAKAKCRKCGFEFEPQLDSYLCPKCSIADVEILQGDEIILKSVDLETNTQE